MSCLLPSCNFLSARTKKQNPFLRPLVFDDCNYLVQITIPQERGIKYNPGSTSETHNRFRKVDTMPHNLQLHEAAVVPFPMLLNLQDRISLILRMPIMYGQPNQSNNEANERTKIETAHQIPTQ